MTAINHLAQTGALEDLIWSIMNDAETEAHSERLVSSLKRDKEFSEDSQEQEFIELKIIDQESFTDKVRETRYLKTKLALSLASKVADEEQNSKQSCMFKHQLLSMAEMRDAKDATLDENDREIAKKAYDMTTKNAAFVIAKFLGFEVESCMACLFEKHKIEMRGS